MNFKKKLITLGFAILATSSLCLNKINVQAMSNRGTYYRRNNKYEKNYNYNYNYNNNFMFDAHPMTKNNNHYEKNSNKINKGEACTLPMYINFLFLKRNNYLKNDDGAKRKEIFQKYLKSNYKNSLILCLLNESEDLKDKLKTVGSSNLFKHSEVLKKILEEFKKSENSKTLKTILVKCLDTLKLENRNITKEGNLEKLELEDIEKIKYLSSLKIKTYQLSKDFLDLLAKKLNIDNKDEFCKELDLSDEEKKILLKKSKIDFSNTINNLNQTNKINTQDQNNPDDQNDLSEPMDNID